MLAALAFLPSSAFVLVLAVAVYTAGLGMVLAQAIAGSLSPFPERAGAASSLFGFVQQSAAAGGGILIGWLMGHSAWPVAIMVATMGVVTFALWLATRSIRRKAVKF
jgi:DHA1 family bicyclomycin/chloramphenicol resistance-like MFS transporter